MSGVEYTRTLRMHRNYPGPVAERGLAYQCRRNQAQRIQDSQHVQRYLRTSADLVNLDGAL